jgi:hypothetical protein
LFRHRSGVHDNRPFLAKQSNFFQILSKYDTQAEENIPSNLLGMGNAHSKNTAFKSLQRLFLKNIKLSTARIDLNTDQAFTQVLLTY